MLLRDGINVAMVGPSVSQLPPFLVTNPPLPDGQCWDLFVARRSTRMESEYMVGDSISVMIAAGVSTEGETRRFTIALQP